MVRSSRHRVCGGVVGCRRDRAVGLYPSGPGELEQSEGYTVEWSTIALYSALWGASLLGEL